MIRTHFAFVQALALAAALLGGRAHAQPPAKAPNADLKKAQSDIDSSSAYLTKQLAAITKQLKEIAATADVTSRKELLEKELGELYAPHKAATMVLLLQSYLATLDRAIADKGLEAQAVARVTEVWKLKEASVTALRQQGMNWSSIILGHALAAVAKKKPADILDLYEKGQSWSEIAASYPVDPEALGAQIEKVTKS